jgi:microcystin-dependent protein
MSNLIGQNITIDALNNVYISGEVTQIKGTLMLGNINVNDVVSNAPPDLDTLREIAANITTTAGNVAAITNSYLNKNTNTPQIVTANTAFSNNVNITGNLRVERDILQGNITDYYVLLPRGAIIIWYGAVSDVPTGWHVCDGSSYLGVATPDLRGRFVLGYGSGSGLTARTTVGATGGAERVTLTTAELPSHTHTYQDAYFAESNGSVTQNNVFGSGSATDNDNEFRWRTEANGDSQTAVDINTGSTGSGSSHENMPPFYVLAYIMKCF